jgi:tetratricopeptide (TPR) repeat protein
MTTSSQIHPLLGNLTLPLLEEELASKLPKPQQKYLVVWNLLEDCSREIGSSSFQKIEPCLYAFDSLVELGDLERSEALLSLILDAVVSTKLMVPQTDRQLHQQIQIFGEYNRAIDIYKKMISICPIERQHTWLRNLGHGYRHLSKYPEAKEYFDRAFNLAENNKNLTQMAMSYSDLMIIYGTQGDLDRSIEMGSKAMDISDRVDLPMDVTFSVTSSLGVAYAYRGERDGSIADLDLAEKYFKDALAISKDDLDRRAEYFGKLINLYMIKESLNGAIEDLDSAIESGLQALELHDSFNLENPMEKYMALGNLGIAYCLHGKKVRQMGEDDRGMHEIDRGIEYMYESRKIVEKLNSISDMVWIDCNFAEVFLLLEDIPKANEHLELVRRSIANLGDARLEYQLGELEKKFQSLEVSEENC